MTRRPVEKINVSAFIILDICSNFENNNLSSIANKYYFLSKECDLYSLGVNMITFSFVNKSFPNSIFVNFSIQKMITKDDVINRFFFGANRLLNIIIRPSLNP